MTTQTQTVQFPAREVPFSISDAAATAILSESDDWKLIVSFLAYTGTFYGLMKAAEQETVRRLADGFGRIDPSVPNYADMVWDWSHVRDSSEEACKAMAGAIRQWVESYRVCGLCGGSGAVRPHPTALVTVHCPKC